MSSQR
jgi:hypothetical protein